LPFAKKKPEKKQEKKRPFRSMAGWTKSRGTRAVLSGAPVVVSCWSEAGGAQTKRKGSKRAMLM